MLLQGHYDFLIVSRRVKSYHVQTLIGGSRHGNEFVNWKANFWCDAVSLRLHVDRFQANFPLFTPGKYYKTQGFLKFSILAWNQLNIDSENTSTVWSILIYFTKNMKTCYNLQHSQIKRVLSISYYYGYNPSSTSFWLL